MLADAVRVAQGRFEIVPSLLSAGAKMGKVDAFGNTALSRAARGGHVECLEALLAVDAVDANLPNDKQQYPLHIAAFKKNTSCVQALINSGKCDYAVQDRKGRIPAMDTSDEAIKGMLIEAAVRKK